MSCQGDLGRCCGYDSGPACMFHSFGTSVKMFSMYPLEDVQSQGVALYGFCISLLGLCNKVPLTLEQHSFEMCRSS